MAIDTIKTGSNYEQERILQTTAEVQENKEGSNPQQKLQIEMLHQAMKGDVIGTDNNLQKQLLQMMSAAVPAQQIQATAQNQIAKGYLDIRI